MGYGWLEKHRSFFFLFKVFQVSNCIPLVLQGLTDLSNGPHIQYSGNYCILGYRWKVRLPTRLLASYSHILINLGSMWVFAVQEFLKRYFQCHKMWVLSVACCSHWGPLQTFDLWELKGQLPANCLKESILSMMQGRYKKILICHVLKPLVSNFAIHYLYIHKPFISACSSWWQGSWLPGNWRWFYSSLCLLGSGGV